MATGGADYPGDADMCKFCGDEPVARICLAPTCARNHLCENCDEIWHGHPDRRNHQRQTVHPPARNGHVEPLTQPPQQGFSWSCPHCTFENTSQVRWRPEDRLMCEMCSKTVIGSELEKSTQSETAKDVKAEPIKARKASSKHFEVACPACTFINTSKGAKNCEVCGSELPQSAKTPPKNAPDSKDIKSYSEMNAKERQLQSQAALNRRNAEAVTREAVSVPDYQESEPLRRQAHAAEVQDRVEQKRPRKSPPAASVPAAGSSPPSSHVDPSFSRSAASSEQKAARGQFVDDQELRYQQQLAEKETETQLAELLAVKEAEKRHMTEEQLKRMMQQKQELQMRLAEEKKQRLAAEKRLIEEGNERERLQSVVLEQQRLENERREREDRLRIEAENKREAEAMRERLRQEEAERQRQEELKRQRREKAERLKREEAERQRKEAERLKREEAERLKREEAEWLKREEAEWLKREEAERLKREQAERLKREEAERLKREEAERLKREEAERLRQEELKRQRREEAERQRKEAQRLKREEAERLKREEAEWQQWEEEKQQRRKETERQRLEDAQGLSWEPEKVIRKLERQNAERNRFENAQCDRLREEKRSFADAQWQVKAVLEASSFVPRLPTTSFSAVGNHSLESSRSRAAARRVRDPFEASINEMRFNGVYGPEARGASAETAHSSSINDAIDYENINATYTSDDSEEIVEEPPRQPGRVPGRRAAQKPKKLKCAHCDKLSDYSGRIESAAFACVWCSKYTCKKCGRRWQESHLGRSCKEMESLFRQSSPHVGGPSRPASAQNQPPRCSRCHSSMNTSFQRDSSTINCRKCGSISLRPSPY